MTDLCREYGEGLYALCLEENLVSDGLSQLETLAQSFREQPEFLQLLSNMSLPKPERLQILDNALRGQIHPYLLNFLKILCERGMLWEFDGCVKAFRSLYYQDHAILEAWATTSVPLGDAQKEKLISRLNMMTGKKIVLKEKVDPSVMGGIMLEMDGKRYDNTIKHRLSAIYQAMNEGN